MSGPVGAAEGLYCSRTLVLDMLFKWPQLSAGRIRTEDDSLHMTNDPVLTANYMLPGVSDTLE